MSYTLEHEIVEDYIVLILKGNFDLSTLVEAAARILGVSASSGCTRILTDVRQADMDVSMMDINTLIGKSFELTHGHGVSLYSLRHALLSAESQYLTRFYESIANEHGLSTKTFHDPAEGKAWLLEE